MDLSTCFILFMHSVAFFSLFHITVAHFVSIHPVYHHSECFALLQFKDSIMIDEDASIDPSAYPKVASWKSDEKNSNCCLWDGVKCDEETGHVIMLDLTSSYLYGSINSSSSLFRLVHLQWLSLADNHFNFSRIPSGIINLTRLSYLDLSFAKFSGQIPSELLELSKLEVLDLSYNGYYLMLKNPSLENLVEKLNNLVGVALTEVMIPSPLPPALTNLSSLTYLTLRECQLEGKIPTSLAALTKLEHLDLSYNKFSGELPSSFGNLTQLNYLGISGNIFLGLNSYSLSWIANLKKLTCLRLSSTNLTGEIPFVLMNLTQLTVLHIGDNHLTGPIPSWLMNLNSLTDIRLPANQLSGHIPVEIGNLTQLEYLRLKLNHLEGFIPKSIFELKNLELLHLSFNNLSGTVDLSMFFLNLKRLAVLLLSSNRLSLFTKNIITSQKFKVLGFRSCNLSEFPYFLHNQDQLASLDLSSNKIAGQVPSWFLTVGMNRLRYLNLSSNLLTGFEHNPHVLPFTFLKTLDLRFNKLQGPLPVPSVHTFSYLVSNNELMGEIQPWICTLNNLHALDLSYNNLSGMLPECLGNFSNKLLVLKLQGNNFHGNIPNTFMKGSKLTMIDLSKNSLQGRISQSLANCLQLKFLNLGNNQITGLFPSWLGTLPVLEVLILKFNRFSGVIKEPKIGFEFSKLRIIDLSHNRFTGNLPSKYFRCWNAMKDPNASKLTYLHEELLPPNHIVGTFYGSFEYSLTLSNKGMDMEYQKLSNLITAIILSNNNFVGEIPTSISSLKGLRTLNISNNNLEGHIPLSLGNLTVLESLDLSNNKLSGEIPQQLAQLTTLAAFDVSYNHLMGPIPPGTQFSTFNRSSFDGNLGLCGEPLSKKCENSVAFQEEDLSSESLFTFGWKIVLIGYAIGTAIGIILGHIFSTRKQEWLAKSFRLQSKTFERKRRHRI